MKSPEYTHIAPVILPDIISAGLFMSTKPAMTKPQLATGPQKWLVLGPTGLFRNDLSAVAMAESTPRGSWNHLPTPRTHTESPHRIRENQREIVGGDLDMTERCSARRPTSLGSGGRDTWCSFRRRARARNSVENGGKQRIWWSRRVVGGWGVFGYSGCVGPRRYLRSRRSRILLRQILISKSLN
jgi:hypothetical protein